MFNGKQIRVISQNTPTYAHWARRKCTCARECGCFLVRTCVPYVYGKGVTASMTYDMLDIVALRTRDGSPLVNCTSSPRHSHRETGQGVIQAYLNEKQLSTILKNKRTEVSIIYSKKAGSGILRARANKVGSCSQVWCLRLTCLKKQRYSTIQSKRVYL